MAFQRLALLGCLAIPSTHAAFWDVFSGRGGALVEPPPSKMLAATSEEGQRVLERLQGRSEANECFQAAFLQAQIDCSALGEDALAKKKLALALAECHLADTRFPVSEACAWAEEDAASCIARLDGTQVQVYTEFFTHADTLCFFLQSEAWYRQADAVSSLLMDTSIEVADRLFEMNDTVDQLGQNLVTRVQEAKQELQDVGAALQAEIDAGNERVASDIAGVTLNLKTGIKTLTDSVEQQVADMRGGLAKLSTGLESVALRLDETLARAYDQVAKTFLASVRQLDQSFSRRILHTEESVEQAKASVDTVAQSLREARIAADAYRQSMAEDRRKHAEERSIILKSVGELHRLLEATASGWAKLQTLGFLLLACLLSWIFTSAAPFRFVRPHLFCLFVAIAAMEWWHHDVLEHASTCSRVGRDGDAAASTAFCSLYATLRIPQLDTEILWRAGGHVAAILLLFSLMRWLRTSVQSLRGGSSSMADAEEIPIVHHPTAPSDLSGLLMQVYALGQQQGRYVVAGINHREMRHEESLRSDVSAFPRLGVELQIALEELRSSGWSFHPNCTVDGCACEAWNQDTDGEDSDVEVHHRTREVSDTSVRIKLEQDEDADDYDDDDDDDEDEDEVYVVERGELQ